MFTFFQYTLKSFEWKYVNSENIIINRDNIYNWSQFIVLFKIKDHYLDAVSYQASMLSGKGATYRIISFYTARYFIVNFTASSIHHCLSIANDRWFNLEYGRMQEVFCRHQPIPIVKAICRIEEIVFIGRASCYNIKDTSVLG